MEEQQYADQILYNYFEDKLNHKSQKFGLEKLQSYSKQLSELNKYFVEKCEIKEESDGRVFITKSG